MTWKECVLAAAKEMGIAETPAQEQMLGICCRGDEGTRLIAPQDERFYIEIVKDAYQQALLAN